MDLGLRERACIVTGASGGIGKATAVALAARGRFGGAGRPALRGSGRGGAGVLRRRRPAQAVALDVTAVDAGERVLEACLERFGRIDALVNNAGTSAVRALEQLTDDEWQGQWELHVMAPMRLMRAAAPEMAERGWGRIVNVCSSSGKRPSSTNMAYSVTKAAELSLSRAFADLYAGQRCAGELGVAGADRRRALALARRAGRPAGGCAGGDAGGGARVDGCAAADRAARAPRRRSRR